VEMELNRIENT